MSAALRNAALMLHGVSEKDRSWIMARLPESTKLELESLIAELKKLGFASEMSEIQAISMPSRREASAPVTAPKEKAENDVVARIEKCPKSVLIAWMHDETEWLVAQVLAHRQWSWADSCLEKVRADKKERLLRIRRDIRALPPLVAGRLLIRLADSLENRVLEGSDIAAFGEVGQPSQKRTSKVGRWLRSFVQRA